MSGPDKHLSGPDKYFQGAGGGGPAFEDTAGALSSVEERPFRIREVEGSNPSVSTQFVPAISFGVCAEWLSVAQLVEHVTVDICDHRVAGSIPAAETFVQ